MQPARQSNMLPIVRITRRNYTKNLQQSVAVVTTKRALETVRVMNEENRGQSNDLTNPVEVEVHQEQDNFSTFNFTFYYINCKRKKKLLTERVRGKLRARKSLTSFPSETSLKPLPTSSNIINANNNNNNNT
ncbi:hypothetical protein TNCV_5063581 [Trichonephila clavipes]|nr:hypothetical protein TNCV_5063581 [Trichonephila clavipes]